MKRLLAGLAILVMFASVAAAQPTQRTVGDRVDDAVITAAVKAKLASERARNLVDVNVDTRDGVVHLQGTVRTDEDRMKAEQLAKLTGGVVAVQNDLKVTSAGSASPGR